MQERLWKRAAAKTLAEAAAAAVQRGDLRASAADADLRGDAAAAKAARSAAQEERRASGRAAGPSRAPAAQGHALAYHAPPGLAGALEAHLQDLADDVAVLRLQARTRVAH